MCFGFLDTSVIVWWLNESNPQEQSDRSFTDRFTYVLMVLQCFKESKEKKIRNEKNTVKTRRGIYKNDVCDFCVISKTK